MPSQVMLQYVRKEKDMATRFQVMQQTRLEHLQALKDQGIDPYTQESARTHTSKEALVADNVEVTVAGKIISWRGHGKIQFLDLKDESGKIQLAFKADVINQEMFDRLKYLDEGDYIQASGITFTTNSGERTVQVKQYQMLTKSLRPLPDSWQGFTDIEERYRQRYVDLQLNPEVKQVFLTRTKIVSMLRKFFDERGFLEVETPVLQPIYGGATAKPFITHHNALDNDFYLRIADELYLKRLIVAGFEKVYEIGHDFRNEGLSHAHSPEFTQIEFYWAYANYEKLMDLTEELITTIATNIKGSLEFEFKGQKLDLSQPWERISYAEAIKKYAEIDINEINNEATLREIIQSRNIKLNLKGIVGYAALLDTVYKKLVRPQLVGPLFLKDYPYEMKPLAKRKKDDPNLTGNFQLLICGEEYVNAYDELNDPQDQRARWEEEAELASQGLDEHQVIDEDYLRALEYGMPPTAGWGLGVDRLTMLLTDQHSIKDVILFPTLKPIIEKSSLKTNYNYREKKIVAIVNGELPYGKMSNALAHLAFSAGHYANKSWMGETTIIDGSKEKHAGIAKYPFIILKADTTKIKSIIENAKEIPNIALHDYPEEMFETGNDEELVKKLRKASHENITYHAVVLAGNSTQINELTYGLDLL
jgi:lysyl-tRNA synthetase, class II